MISNTEDKEAILIIGGGLAGLIAAINLANQKVDKSIILLEPTQRFIFFPLLFELLSDELQLWEAAPLYESLIELKGIIHIEDKVSRVDLNSQIVFCQSGDHFHYSELIICTGSQPNSYGVEGVENHAFFFHGLEDLFRLKSYISSCKKSSTTKCITIAGGGASGIEIACKISDILGDKVKINIVECGHSILSQSKSFNQEKAKEALDKRDIKVHLMANVVSINSNHAFIQDLNNKKESYEIFHDCLIWTAGTKCFPLHGLTDNYMSNDQIIIDSNLRVIGLNNVWSLGDIAVDLKNNYPSTAQVAMQQAEVIVKNIIAKSNRSELHDFVFEDRGEMLSLGIGEATITGMGITLCGSLAYKIRRITYLTKMPRLSLGVSSFGAWFLNS